MSGTLRSLADNLAVWRGKPNQTAPLHVVVVRVSTCTLSRVWVYSVENRIPMHHVQPPTHPPSISQVIIQDGWEKASESFKRGIHTDLGCPTPAVRVCVMWQAVSTATRACDCPGVVVPSPLRVPPQGVVLALCVCLRL